VKAGAEKKGNVSVLQGFFDAEYMGGHVEYPSRVQTPVSIYSDTFFANFTVPASSIGPVLVVATQGSNSASKTFTVASSTLATSQSSSPNLSEKMILPDIFT